MIWPLLLSSRGLSNGSIQFAIWHCVAIFGQRRLIWLTRRETIIACMNFRSWNRQRNGRSWRMRALAEETDEKSIVGPSWDNRSTCFTYS